MYLLCQIFKLHERLIMNRIPYINLPWAIWKTINRLRAKVTKKRVNMVKWGLKKGPTTFKCDKNQFDELLIKCILAPP